MFGEITMAGYVVNLSSEAALAMYVQNGVYATILSVPKGYWGVPHEATFADYATMQAGDNIYFFLGRKIYGIGVLVDVGGDCKFLNYPEANEPQNFDYLQIQNNLLWDEGPESVNQRWVCVFKPSPYFFTCGIDMDDVLSSNPQQFRMLRAFWKVSFIKIDDDENQALMDIILRNNQEALNNPHSKVFPTNYQTCHSNMATKILTGNYYFRTSEILFKCANDTRLRHEMALEAGLLHQLSVKEQNTVKLFGVWDYLSHQVIASPFKPIDYMDRMDVFGYSYIQGFKTKSRFLVAELKKNGATTGDVDQLMKYVDWVKDEYSYGDYSIINAFLIAFDFPSPVVEYARKMGERKYIIGRRPARSAIWSNLKLVKYSFNRFTGLIEFYPAD